MEDLFNAIDYTQDGVIDYLEWLDFLSLMRLGGMEVESAAAVTMLGGSPERILSILGPAGETKLTPQQQVSLRNVLRRASELGAAARRCGVTLMVDAEQTYLQPAIDLITTHMSRKHNRADGDEWTPPEWRHLLRIAERGSVPAPKKAATPSSGAAVAGQGGTAPVIFNTYQAYLKDCRSRLALDMRRAEREGWLFGAKLVRGAYMIQERALATEKGYKDPVHGSCAPACFPCMHAHTRARVYVCTRVCVCALRVWCQCRHAGGHARIVPRVCGSYPGRGEAPRRARDGGQPQ
ncbi:hypothetical protein EON67_01245 [archaeon]|nr:MAG: hypothetical protein EON67_01245 [archaeon]